MMTRKLLPLIPSHHTYCEPFGGGASLLFAKHPSHVEVYNDIDEGLVGFFRVLQEPELFKRFLRRVQATPYSRAEYYRARDCWRDETDAVKRAHLWFIVARHSFGGMFETGWGMIVTTSSRGMAYTCSKWLSAIDGLPAVHARLMRVQIECIDWQKCIDMYDTPDTFFYLDPPYIASTRSAGVYEHELTDGDHAELVDKLLQIKGKAMLSGYDNEEYNRLNGAGWVKKEWKTVAHAAGRTRNSKLQGEGSALKNAPRTECVWLSLSATTQQELNYE